MSLSEPKTSVHLSKGRLVVTRTDPLSYRWLNTSKRSSAPVLESGTKPSSSMMSSLSRASFFCRLSSRRSSRASISSWTSDAAVVKPTDSPLWQAASPRPRATWVLPVPLLPTGRGRDFPRDARRRAHRHHDPQHPDHVPGYAPATGVPSSRRLVGPARAQCAAILYLWRVRTPSPLPA